MDDRTADLAHLLWNNQGNGQASKQKKRYNNHYFGMVTTTGDMGRIGAGLRKPFDMFTISQQRAVLWRDTGIGHFSFF